MLTDTQQAALRTQADHDPSSLPDGVPSQALSTLLSFLKSTLTRQLRRPSLTSPREPPVRARSQSPWWRLQSQSVAHNQEASGSQISDEA